MIENGHCELSADYRSLLNPPDQQKNHLVPNNRAILSTKLVGDCAFEFVQSLGGELQFEYVERGFEFQYQDIKIKIEKVFKLETPNKVSSMVVHEACEDVWVVLLTTSQVSNEAVKPKSDALVKFAMNFQGIADFISVEHYSLQQKVN